MRWFIEDVWGQFDGDHTRHGAPLLPSERKNTDGSCARVGYDALRSGLAGATDEHLAAWSDRLTPHMLRHYSHRPHSLTKPAEPATTATR